MQVVGDAVQKAILDEFDAIEAQGGVLGAVERRYQRSQIQAAAHVLESQISNGTRPIIGLNRYGLDDLAWPELETIRTPAKKKKIHKERTEDFHRRHPAQPQPPLTHPPHLLEKTPTPFPQTTHHVH